MNLLSSLGARRLPVGAELLSGTTGSFRVWAPQRKQVTLVVEGDTPRETALAREADGYFTATIDDAHAGMLYRYRLDDEPELRPDPASRSQPRGHDGPSQLVDPAAYRWRDAAAWSGVDLRGQVLYEMHIGTFTPAGTWQAAARELPWLAKIGITLLEIMPVGEFPGAYGWGYDVVHLYAPTHLYGTPDDMRAFVDTAHGLGMGVILDVVYNHFASVGSFLDAYTPDYFTDRYQNDWGNAINYDGPRSGPVREYVLANVEYWIREFHLDGFRLDATQTMHDSSDPHIIAEISERARAATGRRVVLIGENEPQHIELTRPTPEGGAGLDALWNDDFHHSARVAVTGRREAYYLDYLGAPQELIAAVKWGFLYQGQYYAWQKKCRGTPSLGGPPQRFVMFLQNHDQVANSARGLRGHMLTDPGRWRACTALLLLAPGTPMLFQGQEFAASSPFLYFAANASDIAPVVRQGRHEFLSQFPSIAAGGHEWLRDPAARDTYESCKLDLCERDTHAQAVALHRDLLALRRNDPVFGAQRPGGVDGAVLSEAAFVLRYFDAEGRHGDRLLLVNLGRELHLTPLPEPLLVPPSGRQWKLVWASEDVRYGGDGAPNPCAVDHWRIPAHAALVLAPELPADA